MIIIILCTTLGAKVFRSFHASFKSVLNEPRALEPVIYNYEFFQEIVRPVPKTCDTSDQWMIFYSLSFPKTKLLQM